MSIHQISPLPSSSLISHEKLTQRKGIPEGNLQITQIDATTNDCEDENDSNDSDSDDSICGP